MRRKIAVVNPEEAVSKIKDNSTVMIGEFAGPGGFPITLVRALRDHGSKNLTLICNTAGGGLVVDFEGSQEILFKNHQVRKIICSFPADVHKATEAKRQISNGEVEMELIPQGTLAERIRAGGAGIPAFYTPTGVGTTYAEGKDSMTLDNKEFILEYALRADFALVKAYMADEYGNLRYRGSARHFNPIMATSSDCTIAEVDQIIPCLAPSMIVTPGLFVSVLVKNPNPDFFERIGNDDEL